MADPSFANDIKASSSARRTAVDARPIRPVGCFQDVRDNGPAILEVLRAGTMPCDGQWSTDDIDIIRNWAKIQATIDNARAMSSAEPDLVALAGAHAMIRTRAPRWAAEVPTTTPANR